MSDTSQNRRFMFYESMWQSLKVLGDYEEIGRLFSALCEVVFEGAPEPHFTNPMLKVIWPMFSAQLRESVRIHEDGVRNGRKGGRPRKGDGKKKTPPKTPPLTTPESDRRGTERNRSDRKGTVPSKHPTDAAAAASASATGGDGEWEEDEWDYTPPTPRPPTDFTRALMEGAQHARALDRGRKDMDGRSLVEHLRAAAFGQAEEAEEEPAEEKPDAAADEAQDK